MLYSYSLKGRRDQNEDQHFMFDNFNGKYKKMLKYVIYQFMMVMVVN